MNLVHVGVVLLPGLAYRVAADRRPEVTFKDIRIEAPFQYLVARPLLMELGGPRRLKPNQGGKLVIGVGSCPEGWLA